MPNQQLVPYWDSVNGQFIGPKGAVNGSLEMLQATQVTGASATVPMGIATRSGRIKDARVAAITPLVSPDTFTVDIRKNGTTILTGAISLLSSTPARTSVPGTLGATLTVAAGDFFEAVFTFTHSTGTAPANVIAQLQLILN